MKTIVLAVFMAVFMASCASSPHSTPIAAPSSTAPSTTALPLTATTSTSLAPQTFTLLEGDPLVASLESQRPLIFDYSVQFPQQFLSERRECSSQTLLSTITTAELEILGVQPPTATVPLDELASETAESVFRELADCPGTEAMLKAILQSGLHWRMANCVLTAADELGKTPDLIEQLGKDFDPAQSALVAELNMTCQQDWLDEEVGPDPQGPREEERKLAASSIWQNSDHPEPIIAFEAECRTRSLLPELDEDWLATFISTHTGEISEDTMFEFLVNDTSHEMTLEIASAYRDISLTCGSAVTLWNRDLPSIQLSTDDLLCLSPELPTAQLTELVELVDLSQTPISSDTADILIDNLLSRCGE